MERYLKLHNPMLWGVLSIVFGILFINFQERLLEVLIMTMGGISLLIAVIQFMKFWSITKDMTNRWSMFPITVIITLIIGIMLLTFPTLWLDIFMRLVGIIVLLLSLAQIVYLMQLRKAAIIKVSFGYYVFPIMLFLAGIYAIASPIAVTKSIMVLTGILFILFGASEIINYMILQKHQKVENKTKAETPKPDEQ